LIVSVAEDAAKVEDILYLIAVLAAIVILVDPESVDEDFAVDDFRTVSVLLRDLDELVSESRAHFGILSMVLAGEINAPTLITPKGNRGEQDRESEPVAVDCTLIIVPPESESLIH